MSTFVKQSDVEQEQFDWGTIGWRCRPANTGSKQLVVMDVTLEPGEGHAFHRHDGQEEMIIIKQGRVTQFIERESSTLGVGRLGLPRRWRRPRVLQRRRRDGAPPGRDRPVARRGRLRPRRRLGRRALGVAALAVSRGTTAGVRHAHETRSSLPKPALRRKRTARVRRIRSAGQRRAAGASASRPRIDASTSSIGWNAGSGRPARRSAAVTCTRQPGLPLAYASGSVASTWRPSARRARAPPAAARGCRCPRCRSRDPARPARGSSRPGIARNAARGSSAMRCACFRWQESWKATVIGNGWRSRGVGASASSSETSTTRASRGPSDAIRSPRRS